MLVSRFVFPRGQELGVMTGRVQGKVVSIHPSGDLITDITKSQLSGLPQGDVRKTEAVRVVVDEHETIGIFDEQHGQPAMTLIAILGSDEILRLHLVSDNAAKMLGVRGGSHVEVAW
jgi:S-adenosylmethionine hydrolase